MPQEETASRDKELLLQNRILTHSKSTYLSNITERQCCCSEYQHSGDLIAAAAFTQQFHKQPLLADSNKQQQTGINSLLVYSGP